MVPATPASSARATRAASHGEIAGCHRRRQQHLELVEQECDVPNRLAHDWVCR
jgi:hypothetical protein